MVDDNRTELQRRLGYSHFLLSGMLENRSPWQLRA
jgi:hypothetical protein